MSALYKINYIRAHERFYKNNYVRPRPTGNRKIGIGEMLRKTDDSKCRFEISFVVSGIAATETRTTTRCVSSDVS